MIGPPLAIYVVDPADVHHVKAFARRWRCWPVDADRDRIKGKCKIYILGERQAAEDLRLRLYMHMEEMPEHVCQARVGWEPPRF